MHLLGGLCSCCGLVVLAISVWVAWSNITKTFTLRRLRRQSAAAVEEPCDVEMPELLRDRVPREWPWRGGYVSFGDPHFQAFALHLLRSGAVRRARVLLAEGSSDGDGGWDGRIIYAFRGFDGQVQMHVTSASVDAMHAALSLGVGKPEPAFDLWPIETGAWLHALVDPETGAHVLYEALLIDAEATLNPALPLRRPGRV